MPHFMVLCSDGKEHMTFFTNDLEEVAQYMASSPHGYGIKIQCYEWDTNNGRYEFFYEDFPVLQSPEQH